MSIESFTSNKPYLFQAIYQWILDNDATPHILVDATWPSVSVPQQFVQQGKIILNAAPEAISNWFADNDAVSFSARFSGKSQDIVLPIGSILAIYAQENNLGMAFEPEPLAVQQSPTAKKGRPSSPQVLQKVSESKQKKNSQREALAIISEAKSADLDKPSHAKMTKTQKTPSKKTSGQKPSHLKIIK